MRDLGSTLACLGLGIILASCSGSGATPLPDGGDAEAAPVTCAETLSFALGDPLGHADPLGAAPAEARAGRVRAGVLPADATDLLSWSEGDFLLANDRIAAVIEDIGPSNGFEPWGGKIVGLARVEGGRLVQPADFYELMTMIGRFTIVPEEVSVLQDGSAGGEAIVRVSGGLSPIAYMEVVAAGLLPAEYGDLRMAIDYVLAPGAEHLDIRWHVASPRTTAPRVRPHIIPMQHYRMPTYLGATGFAFSEARTYPWIGFIEDGATSYALESPLGSLDLLLDISGVTIYQAPYAFLDACAVTDLDFLRIYVGGPGLDGLRASMARTRGEARRTLLGTVLEATGGPAEGVRVHAEALDGAHLSRALTDGSGAFSMDLPADTPARLWAWRQGDELVGPAALDATATRASLTMGESGFIHIVAVETVGGVDRPVPVRVQIRPSSGSPVRPPESFGEAPVAAGRSHLVFPIDGEITLRVPVGDHQVTVSRGFEYELGANTEVSVSAGATSEVLATLVRTVSTPGVMCADFHIHTYFSPDSPDPGTFKLAAAAGDGLEIPARSDHEYVRDFETEIAAMGIGAWVYGLTSLELTTYAWGHFGVVPMEPRPEQPNGGWIDWTGRGPLEVFAEVRALPWSPALILNHPRSAGIGGYFSSVGYDPLTGVVARPEMWDESFMLIEAFNASSFERNFDSTVRDWFSFLQQGRPMFAVGGSDNHSIMTSSSQGSGYPRTCLQLGIDEPEALRAIGPAAVRDAALAGAFSVSGGIYVRAETVRGGIGAGGTLRGAGASEEIAVTVQAPSWVDATLLEIYVDGGLVGTVDLPPTSPDALRLDTVLSVDVAPGGSWIVLHAKGELPLDPVAPGRSPFGVTMPIFLER